MDDCLFCRIVSGDVPAEVVFENHECVVFRDINPQANTHFLVVPKMHISSIKEVTYGDSSLLGNLLNYCREVAEIFSLGGYKLHISVGKDGGQEVFHLHIHLMSNFPS